MDDTDQNIDDEIDLKEIILSLWVNKILIIIVTIIFIFVTGFYAINIDKKYTASALFKLATDEGANNSLNLPSLSGLSAFSNMGGLNANLGRIKERTMGRVFIENLDKKIDLKSDIYFNSYIPNTVDPIWKVTIKNILGYSSEKTNENEIIWRRIIKTYRENVIISTTKASNFSIEVTHHNPDRASRIARAIMDMIILDTKNNIQKKQDDKLSYLSTTLSRSLYDLEESQTKLKEFVLENSLMPIEGFASATMELELNKDKLLQTIKLYSAVEQIANMLEINTTNNSSVALLRKKHPIVDQVEFRRIFGQNEVISDWTWPPAASVDDVLQTLRDRKKRLEGEVKFAKENAEKLGRDVERFSNLTRKVKIAEASYTVMIEQVKANSLLAGFKGKESEVYEYPITPISPSAPDRKLILSFGSILGLFFGSFFAVILSKRKGVYLSSSSLLLAQKATFSGRTKIFRKLVKKNLSELNQIFKLNPNQTLRDLKLEISQTRKQFIMISSLGSKLKASDFSRILSVDIQADGNKIAYINFSRISDLKDKNLEQYGQGNFILLEIFKGLKIIGPLTLVSAMDFITMQGSESFIKELKSEFDQVIFSVEGKDAVSLARFLNPNDVFHIALTRKNKTKRKILENVTNFIPFGTQLHD